VPAYCCWNGLAVLDARPFHAGLRFRWGGGALAPCSVLRAPGGRGRCTGGGEGGWGGMGWGWRGGDGADGVHPAPSPLSAGSTRRASAQPQSAA
jgi:hypothetical protein